MKLTKNDLSGALSAVKAMEKIPQMRDLFHSKSDLLFQIVALDGDEEGGTHVLSIHLPGRYARVILDQLEVTLENDLKLLGVEIPKARSAR